MFDSLGCSSVFENAGIATALGSRDAVRFDAGGSTTTAIDGKALNQPPGAGARPVGAVLPIPPSRS